MQLRPGAIASSNCTQQPAKPTNNLTCIRASKKAPKAVCRWLCAHKEAAVLTRHLVSPPPAQLAGMPRRERNTQLSASLHPLVSLGRWSRRADAALWPLWFTLFMIALCSIAWDPSILQHCVPAFPWLTASAGQHAATKLLLPTSRHASWELGHLAGQAKALLQGHTLPVSRAPGTVQHNAWGGNGLDTSAAQQLASIRAQAAELLGVAPESLSPDMLQEVGVLIEQKEQPNVVMTRVRGLFKFANVMWLVGIFGVAISIGPALATLFKPLIEWLLRWARLATMTVHLLARPFYKAGLLYACTCLASTAQSLPEPAGARISLAAVALALVVLFAALQQEQPASLSTTTQAAATVWWHKVDHTLLLNGFAFLALVPLAHAHQSQLLGFFAAAALFGALGFVVVPTGWGWMVGWGSKDAMVTTAGAASIMVTLLTAARAMDPGRTWVSPFQLGFSVFGTLTLLLAGLIYSSQFYRSRALSYWAVNAGYAGLLTVLTLAGALLGMDSMFSVGSTFIALWLSEKTVETFVEKGLGWVAVLAGSLGLCGAAYFIHTHPGWLAMMVA